MAGHNEPGDENSMSTETDKKPGEGSTAAEALDHLTSTRLPALNGSYDHVEAVSHPAHYGGDTTYEALKVIRAWGLGFETGSALKYICRAGKKPGADYIEDLEKAKFYLQAEIDRVNERPAF
jgi:hypothetical protein